MQIALHTLCLLYTSSRGTQSDTEGHRGTQRKNSSLCASVLLCVTLCSFFIVFNHNRLPTKNALAQIKDESATLAWYHLASGAIVAPALLRL